MNHYVYKITHSPTGRWYVGIRSCRCDVHNDRYMGSGKLLLGRPRRDLNKQVLVVVQSRAEAARIEAALIGADQVADDQCLNLVHGGSRGSLGYSHTETHKRYMRSVHAGVPLSVEHRDKIGQANAGRVLSPERRAQISASQVGRVMPESTRAKMRAAWTPERRAAQAERARRIPKQS